MKNIKTTKEELIGTETEKNLMAAFIGESQARNKYSYFATIAKNEGYEQIGAIFEETSNNEKEHAEIWFNILGGILETELNLKSAMNGEEYEFTSMYPEYAEVAEKEGFKDIAQKFRLVSEIEEEHYKRYKKLLENVVNNEVFTKKTGIYVWKCRNCGNLVTSKSAPKICPVCDHEQSYYEIHCKNY